MISFNKKDVILVSFSILLILSTSGIAPADDLECNIIDASKVGYRLIGKGVYYGKEIEFNTNFPKNINRDAGIAVGTTNIPGRGMRSSSGGHSYQLFCVASNGVYLKVFIRGMENAGRILGLANSSDTGETPYVKIAYGYKDKVLYEKARSSENRALEVNITNYELDESTGEAYLEGCLFADWGESGYVRADFNVYMRDNTLLKRK